MITLLPGVPGSLVGGDRRCDQEEQACSPARCTISGSRARRYRAAFDENLTGRPHSALGEVLRIPEPFVSPGRRIARRVFYALTALAAVVLVVWLDRDGYTDSRDGSVSFLDCIYYATVSLSTTGYGDIAPITPTARLVNVVVVTPLRVIFLIILIGTTVEALTAQSRRVLRIQRWRSAVRMHTVVIGYGTKGRAAVAAMIGNGVPPADIVVVDPSEAALERARSAGLTTVRGDASHSDILRLAGTPRARSIVVAPDNDAAAVLVTLTARQLAPDATIIAAARESETEHLLRRSGADSTVVSSETAGRLLGMATRNDGLVDVTKDLLTPHTGLSISERAVTQHEAGRAPGQLEDAVVAVVRQGRLLRSGAAATELQVGDRLLYVDRPD